jgi:hypothetical protein
MNKAFYKGYLQKQALDPAVPAAPPVVPATAQWAGALKHSPTNMYGYPGSAGKATWTAGKYLGKKLWQPLALGSMGYASLDDTMHGIPRSAVEAQDKVNSALGGSDAAAANLTREDLVRSEFGPAQAANVATQATRWGPILAALTSKVSVPTAVVSSVAGATLADQAEKGNWITKLLAKTLPPLNPQLKLMQDDKEFVDTYRQNPVENRRAFWNKARELPYPPDITAGAR